MAALRRWTPFLGAFAHIDATIEAASGRVGTREPFRRERDRIVAVLRVADDAAAAEEIGVLLDAAMAESLVTLRDAVPASAVKGALASGEVVAALGALMTGHASARVRGLAGDVARSWRAGFEEELATARAAMDVLNRIAGAAPKSPLTPPHVVSAGGYRDNLPEKKHACGVKKPTIMGNCDSKIIPEKKQQPTCLKIVPEKKQMPHPKEPAVMGNCGVKKPAIMGNCDSKIIPEKKQQPTCLKILPEKKQMPHPKEPAVVGNCGVKKPAIMGNCDSKIIPEKKQQPTCLKIVPEKKQMPHPKEPAVTGICDAKREPDIVSEKQQQPDLKKPAIVSEKKRAETIWQENPTLGCFRFNVSAYMAASSEIIPAPPPSPKKTLRPIGSGAGDKRLKMMVPTTPSIAKETKMEATKRKLHERYQEAGDAKRRCTIRVIKAPPPGTKNQLMQGRTTQPAVMRARGPCMVSSIPRRV